MLSLGKWKNWAEVQVTADYYDSLVEYEIGGRKIVVSLKDFISNFRPIELGPWLDYYITERVNLSNQVGNLKAEIERLGKHNREAWDKAKEASAKAASLEIIVASQRADINKGRDNSFASFCVPRQREPVSLSGRRFRWPVPARRC